jgi:hypothetical protein
MLRTMEKLRSGTENIGKRIEAMLSQVVGSVNQRIFAAVEAVSSRYIGLPGTLSIHKYDNFIVA